MQSQFGEKIYVRFASSSPVPFLPPAPSFSNHSGLLMKLLATLAAGLLGALLPPAEVQLTLAASTTVLALGACQGASY